MTITSEASEDACPSFRISREELENNLDYYQQELGNEKLIKAIIGVLKDGMWQE